MSNLIYKPLKRIISLFPSTWPSKVYNSLIKFDFLKYIINRVVQWMVPAQMRIPEGTIIFDKDDPVMSGWLSMGKFEPETVACFRSFLKEGMTVVDIGANMGYFTVIAAGRIGPIGKVFAYEPDLHNFAVLKNNIAINNFGNVIAVPIALGDCAGKRELFFGDNNCTHSFSDKKGNGRSETVMMDTLDNSLKGFGFPKIDIIKMDIEGAEPIVLDGMKETIARNPNLSIFFEFYPNAIRRLGYSPLTFLQSFDRLGFSISAIDDDAGTRTDIADHEAFITSFPEKDSSMNLVAVRSVLGKK